MLEAERVAKRLDQEEAAAARAPPPPEDRPVRPVRSSEPRRALPARDTDVRLTVRDSVVASLVLLLLPFTSSYVVIHLFVYLGSERLGWPHHAGGVERPLLLTPS